MAETRRTGPLLEVQDLRVAFRTGATVGSRQVGLRTGQAFRAQRASLRAGQIVRAQRVGFRTGQAQGRMGAMNRARVY